MTTTLYSIGHGHKTPQELIDELNSFSIQFLIDVRSSPFSKWVPHFNRGFIEQIFANGPIRYFYMGNVIGGRPLNDECYDDDGRFDYKKMAQVPEFQEGLGHLINANKKGVRVAIMCSETDPSLCHRSKLIGRELFFEHNIDMLHIIAPQKIKTEQEILIKLTKGTWEPNPMFPELNVIPYFKSNKTYKSESETLEDYD